MPDDESIDVLSDHLSGAVIRDLKKAGVTTIGAVTRLRNEHELETIDGIGRERAKAIRSGLQARESKQATLETPQSPDDAVHDRSRGIPWWSRIARFLTHHRFSAAVTAFGTIALVYVTWRLVPKGAEEPTSDSILLIKKHGDFSEYLGNEYGRVQFRDLPDSSPEFSALVDALESVSSSNLNFSEAAKNRAGLNDDLVVKLAELPTLAILDLSGHVEITDVRPLGACTNLEMLKLNGTSVDRLPELSELPNLTLLDLSETQFSDAAALATSPRLQELYLNGTPVTNIDTLAGAAQLQILEVQDAKELQRVVLGGSSRLQELKLDRSAVEHIELHDLPELEFVTLNQTAIDAFDVSLPQLEEIHLIGNDELQAVSLFQCRTLSVIKIVDNGVLGRVVLEELPTLDDMTIAKNPALRELRLIEVARPKDIDLEGNPELRSVSVSRDDWAEELEKRGFKVEVIRSQTE